MSTPTRVAPRTLTGLVELLLARRESIVRCLEALRHEAVDALSNRDRSDLFDHDDPAADCDADEVLMLIQQAERRLWEVEQALTRLNSGTFGYCKCCGAQISIERLRALPATLSCYACSGRPHHRSRCVARDLAQVIANAEGQSQTVAGLSVVGAG